MLDILQETGLLRCKPENTPIDHNPSFWDSWSEAFEDVGRYRWLIYLTVTHLDISYAVGLISQFMHEPRTVHWQGAFHVLVYAKNNPGQGLIYERHDHLRVEAFSNSGYASDKGDGKSISGYCIYVGGNLVTWRSKKQNVVSRLSAEVEYRSMAQIVCDMMWLRSMLTEFGFRMEVPMPMHCDNQATIFIANNSTFHEHTKHIEVDCHYIREMVLTGIIDTPYTQSSKQLADIFTKVLSVGVFESLYNKLGMINIYAPA